MVHLYSEKIDVKKEIRGRILRRDKLLKEEGESISKNFNKIFDRAERIVKDGEVKKYFFRPSGRIVWTVKGRSDVYQILPAVLYCSCDDFYYRVLGKEKGLCYHLIAYFLALQLGKVTQIEVPDIKYSNVISKIRPKMES